MTRYVRAKRQAEHSGKTGYVGVKTTSPKPFPYGVVEEYATSFYPNYRGYIPQDYRKATDSLYDLRTQKYKYWYDKWGKPHINKWWQGQLSNELQIQKAWKTLRNQKGVQNKYYSRSKYNGPNLRFKHRKPYFLNSKHCDCRHICDNRKTRYRQRPRGFKWRRSW